MGAFVKGDVVVVRFPHTDLDPGKRRPALVLADAGGDDVIVCQITSKAWADPYAVEVENADFRSGQLSRSSRVRPTRLFTIHRDVIAYRAGQLKAEKVRQVVERLVGVLTEG